MTSTLKARQIAERVYWVGAIDWGIRDFHGYSTELGTTYNAYLIMADKVALIDTVKAPFEAEMMERISSLVDPGRIDYVISNHTEMDHSGCLPQVIEAVRPERVFASKMGVRALARHFDLGAEVTPVETGDSVSLGDLSLSFLETRMLHWPDSMFSYLPERKLLFSSDGFGQHWATSERFDHQVDSSTLMDQAAKYYANILLLYSPQVQALLRQVEEMGIELAAIAPDHGLIWTRPAEILEAYGRWSRQEARQKALVIYATMWKSTEAMARAIADGLAQEGVSVRMMDLKASHRSDVITELLDSRAVALGSSTLNNGLLPWMADLLAYMKGLRPSGKIGAAFGSYGWSGEAVKLLDEAMGEMKFEVTEEGIRSHYVPDAEDLERCADLGRRLAEAVKGT